MAHDIVNGELGGNGDGPDRISELEIERHAFQLTFYNLEQVAARLRADLLSDRDPTCLSRLLLEWVREVRLCVPQKAFDRLYGQLQQLLWDPQISRAEKAYTLRMLLNRLIGEVRSCVEIPLPPINWEVSTDNEETKGIRIDDKTRRAFFRAVTVALAVLLRSMLSPKPPQGPDVRL